MNEKASIPETYRAREMTFLRRTLIFFIYAAAALCLFAFWFHRGIATQKARDLPQMIPGQAPTPLVRRQLACIGEAKR